MTIPGSVIVGRWNMLRQSIAMHDLGGGRRDPPHIFDQFLIKDGYKLLRNYLFTTTRDDDNSLDSLPACWHLALAG